MVYILSTRKIQAEVELTIAKVPAITATEWMLFSVSNSRCCQVEFGLTMRRKSFQHFCTFCFRIRSRIYSLNLTNRGTICTRIIHHSTSDSTLNDMRGYSGDTHDSKNFLVKQHPAGQDRTVDDTSLMIDTILNIADSFDGI